MQRKFLIQFGYLDTISRWIDFSHSSSLYGFCFHKSSIKCNIYQKRGQYRSHQKSCVVFNVTKLGNNITNKMSQIQELLGKLSI